MFRKIISGGQVGVDQIALRVAHDMDIETGGHIPDNFVTSRGRQPMLGALYGLKELGKPELNIADAYAIRTKLNVDNSDATLAFLFHNRSGTDLTIKYCMDGKWNSTSRGPFVNKLDMSQYYRPVFVVTLEQLSDTLMNRTRDSIVSVLSHHKVKTLNVAGHRELDDGQALRIELLLYKILNKMKVL
jgi:hypothetical protein